MLRRIGLRLRLRQLTRSWVDLHVMWERAREAGVVDRDEERRFLMLKAKIASRLSVVDELRPKGRPDENRRHSEGIMKLLGGCNTLAGLASGEKVDPVDFDQAWHRHFLFFHQLAGAQPERKGPDGAAGSPSPHSVPTGMPGPRLRRRSSPSEWPRLLGGLAVLAAIAYLLVAAAGIALERSGRVGDAGVIASGWGDLAGRIWSTLPHRVTGFLDPLAGAYGSEVTIALFGLLLLSAGYWVFVRSA